MRNKMLLGRAHDARRGRLFGSISGKVKELASIAVNDYGA